MHWAMIEPCLKIPGGLYSQGVLSGLHGGGCKIAATAARRENDLCTSPSHSGRVASPFTGVVVDPHSAAAGESCLLSLE